MRFVPEMRNLKGRETQRLLKLVCQSAADSHTGHGGSCDLGFLFPLNLPPRQRCFAAEKAADASG